MKIRLGRLELSFGTDYEPEDFYVAEKVCDELCNPCFVFAVSKWWVQLKYIKRRFEDGYWYTAGAGPAAAKYNVHMYTSLGDELGLLAYIPSTPELVEEMFFGSGEQHPAIWKDEDVLAAADAFEIFGEEGWATVGHDVAVRLLNGRLA